MRDLEIERPSTAEEAFARMDAALTEAGFPNCVEWMPKPGDWSRKMLSIRPVVPKSVVWRAAHFTGQCDSCWPCYRDADTTVRHPSDPAAPMPPVCDHDRTLEMP